MERDRVLKVNGWILNMEQEREVDFRKPVLGMVLGKNREQK